MVLVDAGEDDPERVMPDGSIGRASMLAKGVPIPPIKVSGPLRIDDIPPAALAAMRRGIAATVAHANDAPRNLLPADAKKMRTWALDKSGTSRRDSTQWKSRRSLSCARSAWTTRRCTARCR